MPKRKINKRSKKFRLSGGGWIVGIVYFGADMVTQGITGQSIGEHIFD